MSIRSHGRSRLNCVWSCSSGFFSTVHVYDACSGAYIQDLDSRARLNGAQAIRIGPDGLVYVVSEQTQSVHTKVVPPGP